MGPLALGATGAAVTSLQQALVAIGLLSGQPTAQFDRVTQLGVIEAQRRANLAQTGVVDDATWSAISQMQASSVAAAPDPQPSAPGAGGISGIALLFGAAAGLAYWHTHKHKLHEREEEEDDEDEEAEEEDFEPPSHRVESLSDLDDAVTDSLIDEPARISRSGRAGDCKKAVMRLMRVQALVQRPGERQLYDNVVRKVASNCRGQEEAVQAVIEDEAERREDLVDDLLDVVGQHAERERSDEGRDREANIKARLKAQQLYRPRTRTTDDDGPAISTQPNREQSRRKLYESGFRKTKHKLTRKTTSEREALRNTGKGQGNRRGASAVKVRRGGKVVQKLRKEKAKTKRGYTWRKETE